MALLGFDLGGTKLAAGLLLDDGSVITRRESLLEGRTGRDVATLILSLLDELTVDAQRRSYPITGVGISVPGIARQRTGTVWAPNIPGWDDYPLREEVQRAVTQGVPVAVDSDRACAILGEAWKGAARGCRHAIYLTVGTGIGAGILVDGGVVRGARDIAGATGWMALQQPFRNEYTACGCFEYYAAGPGLAVAARSRLAQATTPTSSLASIPPERLTAHEVFEAYDAGDPVAHDVLQNAIQFWGAAAANFVSLFDPERIIFGGGVFGPAVRFLPQIREEATRWAQPISMRSVEFVPSALGGDAPLIGAASLTTRVKRPGEHPPGEA